MKMLALISAGLIAGVALPAASANAQATHTVVKTTTTRTVANTHHVRAAHWRNVCKTRWHNHRKVRTCTKVRYWS